jgi:Trp operon repressor
MQEFLGPKDAEVLVKRVRSRMRDLLAPNLSQRELELNCVS